jgi:hypothetical protein
MDDAQIERLTLRIPSDLHDRLSAEADLANRSLNGEIVDRLASTFSGQVAALPHGLRNAIAERAKAASTSFETELIRLLVAGLDHKAPAVLLVEFPSSTPLAKVGSLIDAAREKLPPESLIRFEPKTR